MSKFTLYTDKSGDIRWKFAASNDKVVARSGEAYRTKDECLKSVALLQKDITGATIDPEVHPATAGPNAKSASAAPVGPAK